jgi:hypothetical protein
MSSPANRLVIALAQTPAIVGDIAANRGRLSPSALRSSKAPLALGGTIRHGARFGEVTI